MPRNFFIDEIDPRKLTPNLRNYSRAQQLIVGKVQFDTAMHSVISAASVATGHNTKVKLNDMVSVSTNIFTMTLIESGGRKTTLFNQTFLPVIEYDARLEVKQGSEVEKYESELIAWEILENTHKKLIRKLSNELVDAENLLSLLGRKETSDNQEEELKLDDVAEQKTRCLEVKQQLQIAREAYERCRSKRPTPPILKRLIYRNATLPGFYKSLHLANGVGSFVHDEARGLFLGKSSVDLTQFCSLWDGTKFSVDYASKESVSIDQPNVSLILAMQPGAFEEYLNKSGSAARDSGFFARVLLLQPKKESRLNHESYFNFNDVDVSEFVKSYESQMKNLLSQFSEKIFLSEEAKESLYLFNRECEDFATNNDIGFMIKDFLAKAVNNACRLAGIIQRIENHRSDFVSIEVMECAIYLIRFYAKEFLVIASDYRNFIKKDEAAQILWDYLKQTPLVEGVAVEKNHILKNSPNPLRKRKDSGEENTHTALETLQNEGFLVMFKDGRKTYVALPDTDLRNLGFRSPAFNQNTGELEWGTSGFVRGLRGY